ncbi:thioredoxin domain-containing protein [Sphingobium sufflavum]|uniref:hypothetical protein n=1 Tax=Sphingobium sufflavum TaxID=1129547 RepID=UPI001F188996|nr:hypothetical protein [Sphingobium sufflavum]
MSMIPLALFGAILSGYGAFAVTPQSSADNRTIILFGASWCAPCLVELRNLPKLAAAAAPDRLVIAWTDGAARRLVSVHPANVELVEQDRAQQLLEEMAGDAAGLPYAVMLDGRGKRCAEWRAPLMPPDVSRFRALCR